MRLKKKRENDIDNSETIIFVSPKQKSEDETDEKIYKEPTFETAVKIEKEAVENKKKISKVRQNRIRLIFKFQKKQISNKYKMFLMKSKKKNQ